MKIRPSRRALLKALAVAGTCSGTVTAAASLPQNPDASCDHVAWVAESLKRILTIQTGMTRKQLMRVFSTEGGLSTALQRTFVSRDCPYFKVNVTFHRAAGSENDPGPEDRLTELESDVIAKIFGPYLQFTIAD